MRGAGGRSRSRGPCRRARRPVRRPRSPPSPGSSPPLGGRRWSRRATGSANRFGSGTAMVPAGAVDLEQRRDWSPRPRTLTVTVEITPSRARGSRSRACPHRPGTGAPAFGPWRRCARAASGGRAGDAHDRPEQGDEAGQVVGAHVEQRAAARLVVEGGGRVPALVARGGPVHGGADGAPIRPSSSSARAVWMPVPSTVSGALPTRRPARPPRARARPRLGGRSSASGFSA